MSDPAPAAGQEPPVREGCRVLGSRVRSFRVSSFGFRVSGSRVLDFGFRASGGGASRVEASPDLSSKNVFITSKNVLITRICLLPYQKAGATHSSHMMYLSVIKSQLSHKTVNLSFAIVN